MEQQNEHIRHFMNVLWADLQKELDKVFKKHIEDLKNMKESDIEIVERDNNILPEKSILAKNMKPEENNYERNL